MAKLKQLCVFLHDLSRGLAFILMGYKIADLVGQAQSGESLGIIRGEDQIELIRALGTAAKNYDLDTEDIISALRSWLARHRFRIIGAGGDWVELRFE